MCWGVYENMCVERIYKIFICDLSLRCRLKKNRTNKPCCFANVVKKPYKIIFNKGTWTLSKARQVAAASYPSWEPFCSWNPRQPHLQGGSSLPSRVFLRSDPFPRLATRETRDERGQRESRGRAAPAGSAG